MTSSIGYLRVRAVLGVILGAIGATIIGETVARTGLSPAALPGFVLGAAMIGLGYLRVRTYIAVRGAAPR